MFRTSVVPFFVVVAVTGLVACGPGEVTTGTDNDDVDNVETGGETDAEPRHLDYAEQHMQLMYAWEDPWHRERDCQCNWEDEGYEGQQECLDEELAKHEEIDDLWDDHRTCVAEEVAELSEPDAGLEAITACTEEALETYETCREAIDIDCWDEEQSAMGQCMWDYDADYSACHAEVDADEFADKIDTEAQDCMS